MKEEYVDDVARTTARYEFVKRLAIVVGFIVLFATLATTVVGVILIRGTQQTGSPILKAVLAGQSQLKDCTEPDGKCFKEGQARQADIIGAPAGPINNVIVLAIGCADKPGTQTAIEITRCVEAGLKKAAEKD